MARCTSNMIKAQFGIRRSAPSNSLGGRFGSGPGDIHHGGHFLHASSGLIASASRIQSFTSSNRYGTPSLSLPRSSSSEDRHSSHTFSLLCAAMRAHLPFAKLLETLRMHSGSPQSTCAVFLCSKSATNLSKFWFPRLLIRC